jgi:hypothetical protein
VEGCSGLCAQVASCWLPGHDNFQNGYVYLNSTTPNVRFEVFGDSARYTSVYYKASYMSFLQFITPATAPQSLMLAHMSVVALPAPESPMFLSPSVYGRYVGHMDVHDVNFNAPSAGPYAPISFKALALIPSKQATINATADINQCSFNSWYYGTIDYHTRMDAEERHTRDEGEEANNQRSG